MRTSFSGYFLKVTSFVLLLSTIPVLLLGMAAYWKSSSMIQEQVVQSNMQVLLQTQMRIEKELKLVDEMANNLIISSVVNTTLRQQINEQDFMVVHQIQQSLNLFNSYELGIRDASLYSLENDWLISASSVYIEGNARPGEEQLADYLQMPLSSFWFVDKKGSQTDKYSNGVIKLVKKLPLNAPKPLGIMVISVSVPDLQTLLADNRLAGTTLIWDDRYQPVAFNGGNSAEEEEIKQTLPLVLSTYKETDGSFIHSTSKGSFAVIYRKASYNNWIYVSVVPIRDITKKSRDIGWYTFYACGALILLTVGLSLLGSNRIYRPVRKLYDTVLGQAGPNERYTRRDELEVIGEQYHSIWHLRNELSAKLERQRPQLKEFYLLKLFSGDAGEAAEKLSELGLDLQASSYHALVLQIDSLSDTRFEERDRDLLLFAINNMVGELIDTPYRLDPVVINQSQVTIIGSMNESASQWKQDVSHWAKLVQTKVREFWGLSVSLGISSPFFQLRHSGKAYAESLEALKYRLRLGNEAILFYADVAPSESQTAVFPRQLLEELVDAIKLADRKTAFDKLNTFITHIVNDEVNHQVYRISFIRLLAELLNVAQETVGGLQHLAGDRLLLFEQLFQLQSVQEIEVWFQDSLIEPLIQILEEKRKVRFQKISDEVKQLIELHFNSELTLEMCADRLSYHPVYVSRIFRKETGMNFSEYLSGHRHMVAKQLLSDTQLSVAEIAGKVGFHNGPNFSRHFKKVEGVTPGHYRELAQSSEPPALDDTPLPHSQRSETDAGKKI
ncbi:helix-turn-helix domain-containing protein [Paenibacillus agricola]|uniref:AraC family transcriptional regulator n=1 Tax=Paenibacillus agricola TaxID=2716264 RepID=A0ABX0JAG1_9BACL|nr:helix-turn-helix domain-containing protein [Paenibacillus agricola]NHN31768.1 AraC family transcriptional regulator [Paenibacillus agricola]